MTSVVFQRTPAPRFADMIDEWELHDLISDWAEGTSRKLTFPWRTRLDNRAIYLERSLSRDRDTAPHVVLHFAVQHDGYTRSRQLVHRTMGELLYHLGVETECALRLHRSTTGNKVIHGSTEREILYDIADGTFHVDGWRYGWRQLPNIPLSMIEEQAAVMQLDMIDCSGSISAC